MNEKEESFLHTRIQFNESLTCDLCNAVMFHHKNLAIHMETHLNKNVFTKNSTYHLKSHKCHICVLRFTTKIDLKRHIATDHLKPHKCVICDNTTLVKRSLKIDIDSVHKKIKPHQRQICDFKTSHKASLKQHIHIVYNRIKSYKCQICDL